MEQNNFEQERIIISLLFQNVNENVHKELIEKYPELTQNCVFIGQYSQNERFDMISNNCVYYLSTKFPIEYIITNHHKNWNWDQIASHPNIKLLHVSQLINLNITLNWSNLSKNPSMAEDIMKLPNSSLWNWDQISLNKFNKRVYYQQFV